MAEGVEVSKGCREACSRLVRVLRSHTCKLPSLHTASKRQAPSLLTMAAGTGSFMAGNMRRPALVYTCTIPVYTCLVLLDAWAKMH